MTSGPYVFESAVVRFPGYLIAYPVLLMCRGKFSPDSIMVLTSIKVLK